MFSRMRRTVSRNSGSAPRWASFNSSGETRSVVGIDLGLVDPPRVVEHRPQAVALDVGADPLDDFRRGERLTENFDRPRPPGVADHIAAGAERLAQPHDLGPGVGLAAVDAANAEGVGGHGNVLGRGGRSLLAVVHGIWFSNFGVTAGLSSSAQASRCLRQVARLDKPTVAHSKLVTAVGSGYDGGKSEVSAYFGCSAVGGKGRLHVSGAPNG